MYYNQLITINGKVFIENIEIMDLPDGKIISSDNDINGLIVIPKNTIDSVFSDGWIIKEIIR